MIYGLLLAAGRSSRMGQPKQLLPWQGRPLVRHVAEVALASQLAGLVVVLGAAAQETRAALQGMHVAPMLVDCPNFVSGQSASLRCGLEVLPPAACGAVVLLVDQPLITPELLNRMVQQFTEHPGVVALVPRFEGRRGNPVLLGAMLFADLQKLEGDRGARDLLQLHADRIYWLDLDDPAVVVDLDTPEAYQSARRRQGEW
jgi:molybdenum cofactor cytidylyltransferase